MIAENSYLISDKKKKALCLPDSYLLVALDAEEELKESLNKKVKKV